MAMMLQGNKPVRGLPSKSAYQGAVENGYTGTEAEFYATLGQLDNLVAGITEAGELADSI